jgi:antitoxin HicB
MNRRNIGSSLESLFDELGEREEFESLAMKKEIVARLELAMLKRGFNKSRLAAAMHTQRPQVQRLLDPKNTSLTIATLARAAVALDMTGFDLLSKGHRVVKAARKAGPNAPYKMAAKAAVKSVRRHTKAATRKIKRAPRASLR